jgi:nicotinamidase-related amidase
MKPNQYPIPSHYNHSEVGKVWRVKYQKLFEEASSWAKDYHIKPAIEDAFRVCLLGVDIQNTFCIPGFELYVAGQSGTGAADDNQRLCEFIYRNLGFITQIVPTMDTHQAMQIFHSVFFVDEAGQHPKPYSQITEEDILIERWKVNPAIEQNYPYSLEYLRKHLRHYTQQLKKSGKYELTIWPHHAMLGGIGHALVSVFEEAVFFHSIARNSQPHIHTKGNHPLTEHYSVFGLEVSTGPEGKKFGSGKRICLSDSGRLRCHYNRRTGKEPLCRLDSIRFIRECTIQGKNIC